MKRDVKVAKNNHLPDSALTRLPTLMRTAKAVLLDRRKNSLVYVLDYHERGRVAKAVVFTDFVEKGDLTNSVRSGGLVPLSALEDRSFYEVLDGEL